MRHPLAPSFFSPSGGTPRLFPRDLPSKLSLSPHPDHCMVALVVIAAK